MDLISTNKTKQTNYLASQIDDSCCVVLPFKDDLVLTFQSLFGGSSSESSNLVPPILKPFDFGFNIFFQIQKLLGIVLEVDSIPCTHCTLPQC